VTESIAAIAADIGTVVTVGILATFLTFFFMMDGDKAWVWTLSSANTWRRDESRRVDTSPSRGSEATFAGRRDRSDYALAEDFPGLLGVPMAGPLA
jgi:predicted PurR-regulated permease PerM